MERASMNLHAFFFLFFLLVATVKCVENHVKTHMKFAKYMFVLVPLILSIDNTL